MVLEPDIRWCANEDTERRREVDCEIPHRLERGTFGVDIGQCARKDAEPRREVD